MTGHVNVRSDWAVKHTPATATQATIARAAVANITHFCTGIQVSVGAVGTASGLCIANLRDSTTGAGNILWSGVISVPVNSSDSICLTNLNIRGVPGQAMTLEFAAAGGAATQEIVSMQGYSTSSD